MKVDDKLQRTAGISTGDTALSKLSSLKDWPEPYVQTILRKLWQLRLSRSKTLWKGNNADWRAGNGFAGSMRPKTLIPADGGSR